MKRYTKERVEAIKELFAFMDDFSADVDMHNMVNGEVIKIDGATLFAGIQSGLACAAAIIESKTLPSTAAIQGLTLSSVKNASQLFIARKEREWDAMAAECARHEGSDDGE